MVNRRQRHLGRGARGWAGFALVALLALISVADPTSARDPLRVPGDFPTIQAALNAAQSGDVVVVSPGVYRESPVINKTVTLASEFHETGDHSKIGATILELGSPMRVERSVGPETKIEGFTMRGGGGADGLTVRATAHILNNHLIGFSDGIDFEPSTPARCVCRNNTFENPSDDGIDLDQASEGLLENNVIRNAGNDAIEIRFHPNPATLNITIRGNTLTGSTQDGIQLIGYAGESHRKLVIERNTITGNRKAGLGLMDNEDSSEDFRAASLLDEIRLFNNTFVGNNHAVSGGDNLVAVNNLFVKSTVGVKGVNGNSTVAHSLFWENGTEALASNVDAATKLTADPRLAPDHTLTAGSPAIDRGASSFAWRGQTVLELPPGSYSGAAPDLGASEFIPPDQRPAVTITSPTGGSKVDGTVPVVAEASDDQGVEKVEFAVNGTSLGTDADGADGWSVQWDSTTAGDGSHTLTATATDTAGQTSSHSIEVNVDNVDDAPVVQITGPKDGSTVSGTVPVQAEPGDDRGVAEVAFQVDGTSFGTDTDGADGWSVQWDSTTAGDGPHTLTAIATDTAGQTSSHSVTVTVGHDAPPTVTITSPANGGTVSGTVQVVADAGDDQGVAEVEFQVDGTSIGADTDPGGGWSASWDTAAFTDGPHTLTATATDTAGQAASDSISVTDTTPLHLSLGSSGTIGGVGAADEDVVFSNGAGFSLHFDGSDVGVASLRIDGFALLDPDTLLLSFDAPGAVPGIAGSVDDSDIVRFDATTLGSTTGGVFQLYFDGSDVGLTTSDEDVDAVELLGDGRILISTFGAVSVPGASGADEDLLAFTPASLGQSTAGSHAVYFDGSDVGLGNSSEDVDGAAVDSSGLHLSTAAAFAVPGVSGQDEDVFVFRPSRLGPTTAGSYSPRLYFDGSTRGLAANNLFAVELP
jgi:hypothetical protein